jgi:hypothetical protein
LTAGSWYDHVCACVAGQGEVAVVACVGEPGWLQRAAGLVQCVVVAVVVCDVC